MSELKVSRRSSHVTIRDTMSWIELLDRWDCHVADVLIDTEDVDKIKDYRWYLDNRNRVFSGDHKNGNKLEHLILGTPPSGMVVDHVNGDTLDCRKSKMRFATNSQNAQNKKALGGASRYRGVIRASTTNKWRSRLKVQGRILELGTFIDEKDAARTYNEAVLEHYGLQAAFNSV